MVKILYDNIDVFSGISPTPFVGLSSENLFYGNRWGTKLAISLRGNITGVCGSFDSLISGQKKLISGFSRDYRNLSIQENGIPVFENNVVQIKNINFGESRYYGFLPFTLSIESYDSGKYWNYFGVTEPKREISVDENDGEVEITYKLSARGFNTNDQNNGLDNARNWVNQYTGLSNSSISGFCLSGYYVDCLVSQNKTIDRIGNSYSIEEKYRANTGNISGIVKYTIDITEDNDNFSTVTVRGEIGNCLNSTISGQRTLYSQLDFYSIASGTFYEATLQTGLNPIALRSGITENTNSKKLGFDISFNNDPRPDVYFDGTISFKTDEVKELTNASLDGEIKCRYGDISTKYAKALNFYTGTNFFDYLNNEYASNGYLYDLNTVWINKSTTFNEKAGTVRLRLETSDRISDCNISYSLSPAPKYIVAIPLLNSTYALQDYGFRIHGQSSIKITYPLGESGLAADLANSLTGIRVLDQTTASGNDNFASISKSVKIRTPII